MDNTLPFSQASENNKLAIHDVFSRHLTDRASLLEIGGGTGQHAVYFAKQFPDLSWQSSDIPSSVATLNRRVGIAQLPNLPLAIPLDVNQARWECEMCDGIFSANSLHIMSADSVQNFFAGVGRKLQKGGLLLVYGPFKYDGAFTTESNARFDQWLKNRDYLSGVRDFEWINQLAESQGLRLLEDNSMPANNQLLVWAYNLEAGTGSRDNLIP